MKQNKFLLLIAAITFSTPIQTIGVNAPSTALTIAAQDENGNPVAGGIPQTGCIALTSSSGAGQFSSSGTNWNPVNVLTMNKGTSNRSFFYQDSTAGTYTLSAAFTIKPTTVTDSCASWAQAEWGTVLRATQSIAVGSGGSDTTSPNSTSSDQTNSDTQTTPSTPATTQQTVSTPTTSVGSETLTVKITSQPVVVVGAGSFFTGSASDSRGLKGSGTRYIWNFGDGAAQEGQTVFHTYTYPGTYAVLMTAASGDETGIGRVSVQVVPAQIGMLAEPDGSVVLSNQSSQELNIGLWNISSGTSTFPIPQDTILLGGQSVHFSPDVMHMMAGADVTLRYPNNTVVSVVKPTQKPNPSGSADSGRSNPSATTKTGSNVADGGAPQRDGARTEQISSKKSVYPESADVAVGFVQNSSATSSVLAAAAEAPTWSFESMFPFLPYALGALGIILVGIGLFFKKTPMKEVTNTAVDEFDIEG